MTGKLTHKIMEMRQQYSFYGINNGNLCLPIGHTYIFLFFIRNGKTAKSIIFATVLNHEVNTSFMGKSFLFFFVQQYIHIHLLRQRIYNEMWWENCAPRKFITNLYIRTIQLLLFWLLAYLGRHCVLVDKVYRTNIRIANKKIDSAETSNILVANLTEEVSRLNPKKN